MKQEKAIIYCAIEKCPHIFDKTIEYCNNKNFDIINSYILNTDIKKYSKKSVRDMLKFIKKQKDKIHIICDEFEDVLPDFSMFYKLIDYIKQDKIELHSQKHSLICNKDNLFLGMGKIVFAKFLRKQINKRYSRRNIRSKTIINYKTISSI